ncbi:HDOD domain-containing protein [Pseudoalteromonas sp. SMS1]|uniref:HDOD domain-containing protein n=1 Tax=Pseudoalteromonas sp. SMS1 TaxID=2908894 RepID=UPI001F2D4E61|nr:HDOD domain-containing protein [Pseudoalteromonas sp. SMS1]MCF2858676.1 HDOD domain-containing protein [Pseudoalteromonas sp. SMS1]
MAISLTQQEKQILRTISIPPRPEALVQFSQETKSPEPNISKITTVLQGDIAISAAILQVVNSAAFRRSKEIESLEQAIMILGLKRLIPLVKAVAVKATVDTPKSLENFWSEQSDIAQLCSTLCIKLNKPALANHAYMLGLFHTVGIPLLCVHFDDYELVLNTAKSEGWTKAAAFEFEKYNTSHATIGALLAQQWTLPKPMINVIYYQHDVNGIFQSGELDAISLELLSILKLARHGNFIAQNESMLLPDEEWSAISDEVLDFMGLSEEELEEMFSELESD